MIFVVVCARIRTHYLDLMIHPECLRGTFTISPVTVTCFLGVCYSVIVIE